MIRIPRLVVLYGIAIAVLFFSSSCDKSTNPKEKETKGNINGTVRHGTTAITSAWLFIGDSLYAATDDSGNYSITALLEGNYDLLCSAINYRDSISQVQVTGGNTITCNFDLPADTTTGYVRGEFQDIILFNDSLVNHPSMANWDAQQIYQSTTGATLISKFLQYDVPRAKIYLGASQISITDDWAMFSVKMQCGTYRITGRCDGYHDANEVVTVLPGKLGDAVYVTFFMMRNPPPKLTLGK